ncbi:MAG: YafY family transcriptional regulator [Chloroflexi bacterium]|nr:YafY family transcriptional regulator [Chloroflexota bacterium]
MNRVDRLFAILLLLQRKRCVRAQDLALKFEVSERTIYRDMEALCESGVPILGTPGEGYELMPGYFLPPLLFSAAEANALFLGARMLLANTTGRVSADAEHALAKITLVLPSDMRAEVERLTEVIRILGPARKFDLYEPHLAMMQQAVRDHRVVHMRYHSLSRDETTQRDVEPHELFYLGGIWYVDGFCRLRQEFRGFRLDRIEEMQLLTESFEIRQPPPPAPHQPTIVRVRFAGQILRWVRERQHYSFRGEEAVEDSMDKILTYHVDNWSELVPWLLGWGAAAIPLEPLEFREAIHREALKIAEQSA